MATGREPPRWRSALWPPILRLMRHVALRRMVGAFTALAFLLVLPLQAGMATPMCEAGKSVLAMAMADGAGPMSSPCDGCAGDEGGGMAMDACFALCAGAIALPPSVSSVVTASNERLTPMVGILALGHAGPPDPYPPRSVVLS